ncbi:MAG TPA: Flp pilus assembly protein CpaB [Peptococcaceae bacterium]|nr:Flp pilus assembly protein CpaB [Peptococcaceae bacterium]
MKNRVLLVLAVLFGLAAAAGTFLYLNHVKQAYRLSGQYRPVVVAQARIPPRTAITRAMVSLKEVPAEYVHPDAVTDLEAVVGKITGAEIARGEQVLKARLLRGDEQKEGLAGVVPPGKRAVAVAVNDVSGVGGALRKGDKVDIVGTLDTDRGAVTTMVLQGIEVLAVNDAGRPAAASEGLGTHRTVVLAVTPQEALPLVLATEEGRIRLLLRSPQDGGTVSLPVVRLSDLAS